ncbi:MAG TPA: GMC oxidoreductase, partial [Xenococcaceae cyanobacterium]
KILVLERGNFLPQEKANWDSKQVHQRQRYATKEVWYDKNGKAIAPRMHYYVGGNTKVYGSALLRMRQRDFEQVVHAGGISPEWAVKYADFAPYYTEAEKLYHAHGQRGLDPTEPPTDSEYPHPPVSHEPYVQDICYALKDKSLHPFNLPLGIKLNEVNRHLSACIRCDTCDPFPCMLNAKADADLDCMRPAAIAHSNITLKTEAKVICLHTSPSGREVTGVETEINGEPQMFSADIVVVACGAANSAVLLLRSANQQHPNGLANSSDLVGRNYMCHNNGVIMGLSTKLNTSSFAKTMAIHDFYWGEPDFDYPMGALHSWSNVDQHMLGAYGLPFVPAAIREAIAKHSFGWWVMCEDLPQSNNRVRVKGDKIFLEYTNNNLEAYNRLIKRWLEIITPIENRNQLLPFSLHFQQKIPLEGVGHQCGTCVFGTDPKTSVLNPNCRTHDVQNLYVVDGSFFPSSSAVNPSLTIIANALRVGDLLLENIA